MASLVRVRTFTDDRGALSAIESAVDVPFPVARVYYIYHAGGAPRGGHRHKRTSQALVCVAGACEVVVHTRDGIEHVFALKSPDTCLLLDPDDWHVMRRFSPDAVLLVLASEHHSRDDYVFEDYPGMTAPAP